MLGIPVLDGRIEVSDVDGDGLQYSVTSAPGNGSISLDDQGQWQFTPTAGFYGEDLAEVTISDGAGGETRTTLRFLVNTYKGGELSLPEDTVDTLYLQDIGKADLEFSKDGNALMIDIRQKGSIRVNGYFLAPEKGLQCIETTDGPISLKKEYIVDVDSWCSVLNGTMHGLMGDKLLVNGTDRPNVLLGAADNDVILGAGGGDYVHSLRGNDLIVGGSGNDNLYGNDGNDTPYGDQDNDYLSGGSGDDFLIGGDGNDQLSGGSGCDHLNGGQGNDTLTGGGGKDIFVFDTELNQETNKDTIVHFSIGQDKIELDRSIFSSLPEDGSLFSDYFLASSTGVAVDDNDYLLYNTTSGALLYDIDGNGQGVAVEFAKLTCKPELTAKDFVIAS